MSFSQAAITSVSVERDGVELHVSWVSTAANWTWYQVYLDRELAWYGQGNQVWLPWPGLLGTRIAIDVGTVDVAANRDVDYSSTLGTPNDRCRLTWEGGTFEGDDILGFRVYQSLAAGGAVSYVEPKAEIPAYTGGSISDGFGLGGFGLGGFGRSVGVYSWTSDSLSAGAWSFAVCPYDLVGNELRPGTTASFTSQAPPRAPAPSSSGKRLSYTFNPSTMMVTLSWLASPV